MRSISKILMVITVLLSSIYGFAQISNAKSVNVKIFGNCAMCKEMIENAGNDKKTAKVDWNKETKLASITYDSKKTDENSILKRIALAGFDNESFLAPDDAFAKLPECCKYKRDLKTENQSKGDKMAMKMDHGTHNHDNMNSSAEKSMQNMSQLSGFFDNYFSIKDALTKDNSQIASSKAADLASIIKSVQMDKLSATEHTVWMKVMNTLLSNAEGISKTKDISKQRNAFVLLSKNVYELAKVSKQNTPVYYQHCPMFNNGKGADWLSKGSAIKNPYYGTKMSTCGSTTETIK
ncbi:mercury transporter [Elizabethkingia sp. HvH-WGS333]|uniref:Putative Co/Zn/Cd efflux system membrane fusion protein n=2 Tax=Elizabethkingia anophelis TaxID=1117645 RepID=A0A455ZGS4_9FLAO|nr:MULTISPECIES: DUF3347 domain-containing protein [Elizabethkingia]MCL1641493.1 DUF3347 domain-containing protein [Elizabethkingia anophelis]MCL1646304.1 DUF3347 domain-containing protein [Elizabethkingia anophelis]MDV3473065.1 DUF3347 domain-containing protein [Elizabethkingia anophelis]OIK45880.1 mercury transporter [Elizabethkingia sp. HvH-WGS333]DAC75892.1 TPA_exp: putative Co/Zn/Cd efflux system membrane fusion protein [Elizabethkingia anophelis]